MTEQDAMLTQPKDGKSYVESCKAIKEDALTQAADGKWYDQSGKRVWRAGTLVYDRKGLFKLFFWLFIGQFTYMLEKIGLPMMLPLHLKNIGMSTPRISWLMSIMFLGALVVAPAIGMWSDRTRTRWGRRRPFDILTTPIWFIGLLLMPFAKSFVVAHIAMVMIGFAGAATVVVQYMYNDIIPGELMGRFVGALRLSGQAGGLIFQLFVFGFFDNNPTVVWIVIAVVAFTFEMLMLFNVKEGSYPPPPPRESVIKKVKIYLKEGFGSKYMNLLWSTIGMIGLGAAGWSFYMLFFKTNLGMTSKDIGTMCGIGTVFALLAAYPFGILLDRYGPAKLWFLVSFLCGCAQVAMFLFAKDRLSSYVLFSIYTLINSTLGVITLGLQFAYIPKKMFGQLSSCFGLVAHSLHFVGVSLCGLFIVAMGDDYRYSFLFAGVLYALSPVFLFLMLRCKDPYAHLEKSMKPSKRK